MITSIDKTLKKIISGLGVIVMAIIIFNSLVSPTLSHIASYWRNSTDISEVQSQNILSLVLAVFIILFLYFLSKKFLINDKISHLIATALSILFFIFLLWQFEYLQIEGFIDDSYLVFNAAQEFLDTGKVSGWYMAANPQNLFIMFFYMLVIKLTGSAEIWNVYVIFSLIHVATAALIYVSSRKLFNKNVPSLIALVVFICTFQINMHVAIMYTDVLSMFFLMLGICFYIYFTKASKNNIKLLYLFVSSFFFSIAFLAKGFYLILFIATVLGMLISLKRKEKLLAIIPIVTFFLINTGWDIFISSQNMYEKEEIGMPNTHYMFMGMNTDYYFQDKENKEYRLAGAYNDGDVSFSKGLFWDQNLDKNEISKIHFEKIHERIQSLSTFEFFEFLWGKISSSWSSGDLKSTVSIGMASGSEDGLKEIRESKGLYTYLQTIQYIYYLIFLLVFTKLFLSPSINSFMYVSVFFVIGIFFFVLMWEASPRYAMTVMPFAPVIFPYFLKSYPKKEK